MNCSWYVQANLNAKESVKIQLACEANNKPVKLFTLIPFTTKMSRLGATMPFVLTGSTTLNRNALNSKTYKKGIFFNHNFTPKHYMYGYGDHYLNDNQVIFEIQNVPKNLFDPDEEIFIRSNDDSKQISGGTCKFSDLLEIQKNTNVNWMNGDLFSPDSQIVISTVKQIHAEYRFVICNDSILGCSRYRPSIDAYVPQDVKAFALDMTTFWQPHDVFVLDICETNNGLKVVECNCVNGSGWYDADYSEIVWYLSKYQEEKM